MKGSRSQEADIEHNPLLQLERATSTRGDYIDALTGLRGLAAVLVMMFHLWMAAGPRRLIVSPFDFELDLTILFSGGWVGVDIFFVLSGFLLAMPFLHHHLAGAAPVDLSLYFRRRFYRVLPAYYVQLFLLLAIIAFTTPSLFPDIGNIISHLLMAHNFRFEYNGAINQVYWTLPVEFGFYLVLPLLLFWIRSPRQLLLLLLASLVLSIGYRYLTYPMVADGDVPVKQWLLNQLPGRLSQFISGIYAAFLYLWLKPRTTTRPVQRLSVLLFLSGLVAIIALLKFFSGGMHKLFWQGHWSLFTWHAAAGLAMAALILGLALNQGIIKRLLAHPAMLYLGLISYSLYLWHLPVIHWLSHGTWIKGIEGYRLPWLALASLPVILILSSLSYYYVERPFLLVRGKKRPAPE